MKRVHYPAVIDKDPDSDYGVVFPDFPGCVSAGSTLDEAVLGAHEALAGHVALMVTDGDALPEPTPLEVVAAQRDAARQGAAREHHDGRGAAGRDRRHRRQPVALSGGGSAG
jgi:predicted RNase H-like HicB family nuclease